MGKIGKRLPAQQWHHNANYHLRDWWGAHAGQCHGNHDRSRKGRVLGHLVQPQGLGASNPVGVSHLVLLGEVEEWEERETQAGVVLVRLDVGVPT